MKTSKKGIELIKRYEGFELVAYWDKFGEVYTIGIGHTKTAKKGMVITEKQAEELLALDLQETEGYLQGLNISQIQFDAIVSLVFNIGIGNFRSSTLYRLLKVNPNDMNIAQEFVKWKRSGGKELLGLLRRRISESELYYS